MVQLELKVREAATLILTVFCVSFPGVHRIYVRLCMSVLEERRTKLRDFFGRDLFQVVCLDFM